MNYAAKKRELRRCRRGTFQAASLLANSDPTFSKGEIRWIFRWFLRFQHTTTLNRCRTDRFLQCQLVFHNQKCCFDENCAWHQQFRLSVTTKKTAQTNVVSSTASLNRMVERESNAREESSPVTPPSNELNQWQEMVVYLAPRNKLRPGPRRFCKRGGLGERRGDPFIIFNPFFFFFLLGVMALFFVVIF